MRYATPAPLLALPLLAVAGFSLADGGRDELPLRLDETGLYDADGEVTSEVLSFSPQYPLWTDGAIKRRWILLPEGAAIDGSDPDRWDFPVGTRIWKEFSFGRPVETRHMERTADGWRYGAYVWSADGSEAVLAPRGATVAIGGGALHDVPSQGDCAVCHDAVPVIGFSALQLSPDRDPLAPHAEPLPDGAVDLTTLIATGRLVGYAASTSPRIAGTPTERAALGYLHGNCGGCHEPTGALASLGMDLHHPVADPGDHRAARTTAGQVGRAALPADPAAPRVRVAPGDPGASVLLGRMRSRQPQHQMPPLGTRAVDDEAVALIARWILEMDSETHTRRTEP